MSQFSNSSKSHSQDNIIHTLELPTKKVPSEYILNYFKDIINNFNCHLEIEKIRGSGVYNHQGICEVLTAWIYYLDIKQMGTKDMEVISSMIIRLENVNIPPNKVQLIYFLYYISNLDLDREKSVDKFLDLYS
jgi:hypothetical protein